MNIENILKLIDAGFTAEDIRGMIQEPAAPAEPAPAADPEPAAPAPAPADQPGLNQNDALAAILNRMNDTLNRIQAANVIHDNTSSAGTEQTADDIIQDLIYPGHK